MKRLLVCMMVICMVFGVVMSHSYAAEQQSNNTYATVAEEVKFQQIDAGAGHSLALSVDGTVYSWGQNRYGQLGDGTFTETSVPKPIMDDVKYIAATYYTSYAITTSNELYAWGLNITGQLGNGTTTNQAVPVKIMDNVQAVDGGNLQTLILTMDGELYGTGKNIGGALGQGVVETVFTSPIKIMDNIQKIDAKSSQSMALSTDGVLYYFGTVGPTSENHYVPTIVMDNIKDMANGSGTVFAVTNDNELYGWGINNSYGTLLNNVDLMVPTKLLDHVLSLSVFTQVLLLDMDHNLITWGFNANGELGNGTKINSDIPTEIMENIIMVEAQDDFSFALSEDGDLYTWGSNANGRLGNGLTTGNTLIPTKIYVFEN